MEALWRALACLKSAETEKHFSSWGKTPKSKINWGEILALLRVLLAYHEKCRDCQPFFNEEGKTPKARVSGKDSSTFENS